MMNVIGMRERLFSHRLRGIAVVMVVSVLLDLLMVVLYDRFAAGTWNQTYRLKAIALQGVLLIPVALLIVCWIIVGWRRANLFLHRNRFAIGICIVLAAVVLNLNGSSMGAWNTLLQSGPDNGAVFGMPRLIRTDEYVVGTSFAFAQSFNGYGYFNTLIGGTTSDMFIIKDAPVWTLAEIFRPFHWGYLLLGSSRGLAFYWSARLVALTLVSYQFFLMVTSPDGKGEGQKTISAVGAVLVAFSPIVQWWFAVNNIVEMLVAVMLSTVMLSEYCKDHKWWHRLCYAVVIMICAGMFVFSLYPAWQVPLGYVLLAVIIWQLAAHWGGIRMTARDWCIVIAVVIIFGVLCLSVWMGSRETIEATMNTVYPGRRHKLGGGSPWQWLFASGAGLVMPFKEYVASTHANGGNVTEASGLVDFFPLGLILSGAYLARCKGRDLLSWLLIAVGALFGAYALFGVPDVIATVTLLSMTVGYRIIFALGLVNLMLLLRGAALCRNWLSRMMLVITLILYVVVSASAAYWIHNQFLDKYLLLTVCAMLTVTYVSLMFDDGIIKRCCSGIAVFALIFSGVSVNPVRYAAAPITQQPFAQLAIAAQQDKPGTWMVIGDDGYLPSQLLVANGMTTLNTVAVTPNMRMWKKLDPDGRYVNVYNRYAFLKVHVVADRSDFTMKNPVADVIELWITPEQLHTLGVDYVMSSQPLDGIASGGYTFKALEGDASGYRPYELVPTDQG